MSELENLRRENEALHMRSAGVVDEEAEMKRLRMSNLQLKRKLGDEVSTEEVLAARGIKTGTARQWHEGRGNE